MVDKCQPLISVNEHYDGIVTPPAPDDDLGQIWLRLLPLFTERHDRLLELVRRHGLTPPHGFMLASLSFGPMRMRDLAELMVCDASYVTGVVDRLEELELAQRRPSERDRRVKEIELTPAGRRLAQKVTAVMTEPPAELAGLGARDRATLRRILEQVLAEPEFPPAIFRSNRR